MSVYVVDSSVAIKWYVPEVHQTEAVRLRASGAILHAPDFLNVEVAAVLWKKLRKGELTRHDADDILNDLSSEEDWLAPILCTRRCESRNNRYRCVLGPA